MAEHEPTEAEQLALSEAQARGGADQPVEGIDERTSQVNPDSAFDTRRPPGAPGLAAGEHGGVAGPVGYFEGEGNEGPFAPLGGDPTKSASEVAPNDQGGAASGAPDTAELP